MSNQGIVEHKANMFYVEFREDYLLICLSCAYKKPIREGQKNKASPYCKALILAISESWTNDKRGKGQDLAFYMTYPQWIDAMYGMFGRTVVIDSLDELLGEGLLRREAFRLHGKDTFKYYFNHAEINRRMKTLSERSPDITRPLVNASTSKREASTSKPVTRPLVNGYPSTSGHNIESTQNHSTESSQGDTFGDFANRPPSPSSSVSVLFETWEDEADPGEIPTPPRTEIGNAPIHGGDNHPVEPSIPPSEETAPKQASSLSTASERLIHDDVENSAQDNALGRDSESGLAELPLSASKPPVAQRSATSVEITQDGIPTPSPSDSMTNSHQANNQSNSYSQPPAQTTTQTQQDTQDAGQPANPSKQANAKTAKTSGKSTQASEVPLFPVVEVVKPEGKPKRERGKQETAPKMEKPKPGKPEMPAEDLPLTAESLLETFEFHLGRPYPNGAKNPTKRVRDKEFVHCEDLLSSDYEDIWAGRTPAECRALLLKIVTHREKRDNGWWESKNGKMVPHQLTDDDRIHKIYDELVRMRKVNDPTKIQRDTERRAAMHAGTNMTQPASSPEKDAQIQALKEKLAHKQAAKGA